MEITPSFAHSTELNEYGLLLGKSIKPKKDRKFSFELEFTTLEERVITVLLSLDKTSILSKHVPSNQKQLQKR